MGLKKFIAHLFLANPSKRFTKRRLREFAEGARGKKILEIGTGDFSHYKISDFFDKSNQITFSDIEPQVEGCLKLDISKKSLDNGFDVIVSINVLEHVFDFAAAVENMRKTLKQGGRLFLEVPLLYPSHSLPHDYWRFTPQSLEKIFSGFSEVKVEVLHCAGFDVCAVVKAKK